ncbi:hypothetical protein ES703_124716 [subsurface metagenome]
MEKDIGKINKNDTTDIVLRIDDFAERKGLTIREFITSDRYTGFTKSGVKIMAGDFPKFKEMINSISEEDMKEESPSEETEPGQKTLDEETESTEEPEIPELPEKREEETETGEGTEKEEEIKVEKPGEELPDY